MRRAPPEHGADPAGLRGRNLHLHPATRVGALFDEDVRGWEEVPQAYNVDHFTREGIFIQDQFVPPAMEAPVLPGVGTARDERMAHYARLGSFGALVSEESAGRVRATRAGFPRVTYQLNAVRRSDGAPAPASHAAMTASRGPAS